MNIREQGNIEIINATRTFKGQTNSISVLARTVDIPLEWNGFKVRGGKVRANSLACQMGDKFFSNPYHGENSVYEADVIFQ